MHLASLERQGLIARIKKPIERREDQFSSTHYLQKISHKIAQTIKEEKSSA